MKVSIIVSVYNGADILPVTIPALLQQDYPQHLTEIICVDDASTDNTETLLSSPDWQDKIKVIRHDRNKGRCATRNTGIKAATGNLLILMDYEIEVQKDFISKHVAWHEKENVIGVVSNLKPKESDNLDKYQRYIFYGKRGARLVKPGTSLPFKYFILGCSSVKVSAVEKTGLFNEALPGYGIDLEYAYRLWQNHQQGLFFASDIEVYMHKLKTLERAMEDFREYGAKNVPVILNKFPELASYVGADFISLRWRKDYFKRILGMLFINSFSIKIAKLKQKILPYPISNLFTRYLLLASVASGYRSSLKK